MSEVENPELTPTPPAADPFAGGQEVAPNQARFNKIGDYIVGYFVGSKDINGKNGPIKLYELKGVQGEFHEADVTTDENGNKNTAILEPAVQVVAGDYYNLFGGKDSIDSLFAKAKINQKVGLKFEKATPSKIKGNSPFKTIKTVMWDDFDKPSNMIDDSQTVDSTTVPGVDF